MWRCGAPKAQEGQWLRCVGPPTGWQHYSDCYNKAHNSKWYTQFKMLHKAKMFKSEIRFDPLGDYR
jgi:hypothetical protein